MTIVTIDVKFESDKNDLSRNKTKDIYLVKVCNSSRKPFIAVSIKHKNTNRIALTKQ